MARDTQTGVKPSEKRQIGFLSSSSGPVVLAGSPVSDVPDEPKTWVPTIAVSHDPVKSPSHYARLNPQPIKVSTAWFGPAYLRGTAIKYLARAGFKTGVDVLEDLQKAINYIQEEIDYIKEQRNAGRPEATVR